MITKIVTTLAAITFATAGFAESHSRSGDAAAGEKEFNKCKACHSITADDGTDIVKGGKVGPNLYGVVGRAAASVEDFRYGDGIEAAGEKGLIWDEPTIVSYLQDPNAFLKDFTGDKSARSKMSFKLRKGMEDVYAYLVSVGPAS